MELRNASEIRAQVEKCLRRSQLTDDRTANCAGYRLLKAGRCCSIPGGQYSSKGLRTFLNCLLPPIMIRGIRQMSHFEDDKPEVLTTKEARAGVTGHNVRYVLAFGLAGAFVALALILLAYF
jgi:hypothetical protein